MSLARANVHRSGDRVKRQSAISIRVGLALLAVLSLFATACGSSSTTDEASEVTETSAELEADESTAGEEPAAAEESAASLDKVVIGQPSWPGAQIISHVLAEVISTDLGGETDFAPGANAVIFEAMDGGRGDIDVHPDVWLPNQASFTDEYVDAKGTVALSDGSYAGQTGFCVPTYVAEQGVTSVFDLATPEAQELFDTDGDGQGEIWVGATGWASTNVHLVKARDYGIDSFLEPGTEDEAVFYGRLESLIEAEEAAVFYCYSPHYVHALHDVTMLEEPEYDEANYTIVQPDESDAWFEESSISSGDQVKTVRIAYSRSLEERAPAVAELLSRVDLDQDAVSDMTYQVSVLERDMAEVAAEWVAANRGQVDGWLGLS